MSAPTEVQLREAFNHFDSDKSGRISTQELGQVLTKCNVQVTEAQCAQLIKMFDADGSGQMEYPEFQQLVQQALKK